MTSREHLRNTAEVNRLLRLANLDALVTTTPENVCYLAGLYIPNPVRLREREHVVVWPSQGEPTLITPQRQSGEPLAISDVRGYDFYQRTEAATDARGHAYVHRSAGPLLIEVLKEKDLGATRIGVERSELSAELYQLLNATLPHATFVDSTSLLQEARMAKTPQEIELLRAAANATAKAIQVSFELARPGDTARDLAHTIESALLRFGADSITFIELEVIRNDIRLDYFSHNTTFIPGDIIRVDVSGCFAGYMSDIARTGVVLECTTDLLDQYHKIKHVQTRIIHEAIIPGHTGADLYARVDSIFRQTDLKTPWGMIVHGIGLGLHERPWLREVETFTIRPNMTLMVEIYYHGPDGQIRQHVEDLVVVADAGAMVVNTFESPPEPFVIQ